MLYETFCFLYSLLVREIFELITLKFTYTYIKPSAQLVWPVVGQEILNGDVGGNFQGFVL